MKFLSLLLLSILISSPAFGKTSFKAISQATVMVVRPDERSGGTGVILHSTETMSVVLTNNHVCEVIANGGLIITDDNLKYNVTSYKQSKLHDLCTINVSTNLHVSTDIASTHPEMYEETLVSGHPSLYPTIVTTGHFSAKRMIEVMMGVQKCTKEDMESPDALLCIFLGGKPIIRQFETQVISATIKPGSSGSPVYNANNELAGLVFAGSGDLGYGMIVPHEYIINFLAFELRGLELQFPNSIKTLSLVEAKKTAQVKCKSFQDSKVLQRACRLLENNMLWVSQ